MSAAHAPVLLEEVLEALAPAPGARLIDATFGAGGYSRALLDRGAAVAAFDRDPAALTFARPLKALYAGRFALISQRFSELEAGLAALGAWPTRTDADVGWDGVVFDLGVSSMQLDAPERGFSFMRDGPLDMRMGQAGSSAADLVNTLPEADLAHLIWLYGEERASRRIAAALVARRKERPFHRTLDLAEVVERVLGGRRGAPVHPATRTFQGLRIAVNEELAELEAGLKASERVLAEGGRLVVVAFHSLEDRIVKAFLSERAGRTPSASRHLPPSAPGPRPSFELVVKGAKAPGQAEIARNPRARSAKLRAAVRTAAPPFRSAA